MSFTILIIAHYEHMSITKCVCIKTMLQLKYNYSKGCDFLSHLTIIITIAVIGPLIGAFLGVIRRPNDTFVCNMLSFSAGIMLSVSFLEIIPESIRISNVWICLLGIILGSILMYSVDKIIPHIHPEVCSQEQGRNLKKTAFYLILGMFLHHFPEGMSMAVGNISNFQFSLTIALAIAIHDIPEGITTASTYYFCTGKRLKSFLISFATAVPTLIGFLFASVLYQSIPKSIIGLITSATAGLMIYICGDELIPSSAFNSNSHSTIFSLIAGVVVVVFLGAI